MTDGPDGPAGAVPPERPVGAVPSERPVGAAQRRAAAAARGARVAAGRSAAGPGAASEGPPTVSAPASGEAPAPGAPAQPAGRAARRDLDPDALAALEEERDFLLRSLDDLAREHDAGDVDDDDYQALADDYTARAAATIRAIDERHARRAAARPPRSLGRIVAGVAIVVGLGVGAGWLVAATAGSRDPGETITGDIRRTSIEEIAQGGRHTAEGNELAVKGEGAAAVEAYKRAIDAYQRALEIQPGNVEAMTYRGWLMHNIALKAPSQADVLDATALEWLTRAITTDPTYADARIFRAILLEETKPAEALADLDAFDPAAVPSGMQEMVATLRARIEAAVGR